MEYTAEELTKVSKNHTEDIIQPVYEQIMAECHHLANNYGEYRHSVDYIKYGVSVNVVDKLARKFRAKGFKVGFNIGSEMVIDWNPMNRGGH